MGGDELFNVIENGVSMYPNLIGSFIQPSTCNIEFDSSRPPNDRVNAETLRINKRRINKNKMYTVTMPMFLSNGKDGYTHLNA